MALVLKKIHWFHSGFQVRVAMTLCKICYQCVRLPDSERAGVVPVDVSRCALCLGILSDAFCARVAERVSEELRSSGHSSPTFLLAVNMPVSIHLRQAIVSQRYGDSPSTSKDIISAQLLSKIREATGMRPSLNSPLAVTITFEQDEFDESDARFLASRFPREFTTTVVHHGGNQNRKRKRPNGRDEGAGPGVGESSTQSAYTKTKVKGILSKLTRDITQQYELVPPTRECTLSVAIERDATFVGGRYCKYSRLLPQSPWTAECKETRREGESVSEKICDAAKRRFRADSAVFIASGREDIDVRMVGDGRPFAVQLTNAKEVPDESSLAELEKTINAGNPDIRVLSLAQVNSRDVLSLNVGLEEKRKTYMALCYSTMPLDAGIMDRLANLQLPIEIAQKTAIRVLKRRPLLERKRTIFAISAHQVDHYHFHLRLETQAGTYVKEFVHSDFGRTQPSLAELMGLGLDDVDILELDVEAVHLEWPPHQATAVAARQHP